MIRNRLLLAGFLIFLVTSCSAFSGDTCNIGDDWFAASGYDDGKYDIHFNDGPITFNSGQTITGGKHDGVRFGGFTATKWECEGNDRVILSAAGSHPMGGALAKRVKISEPGMVDLGMGIYLVRRGATQEDTWKTLEESLNNTE